MSLKNNNILALGGLIGPVLFSSMTLLCASLRPGYSHLHNFISELGASGTANTTLMNYFGFVPSGIAILLFGYFMLLRLPNNFTSKIGALLIFAFGLGMVTAGIFSCDAGCVPDGSYAAQLHDRVSALTFPAGILGILLLGFSFRSQGKLRKFTVYSLLTAMGAACFMILMIGTMETRVFTGVWQRLLLFTLFQWFVVLGYNLYQTGRKSQFLK